MARARTENFVDMAQQIERDLHVIRDLIRRPLNAEFARGNLTGPQKAAMRALVCSGGMSLKELSGHLGVAHSTMSGIVDRLEKRGLVERRQSDEDRRVTRIVVTRAVQKFVQETMPKLLLHPLAQTLARATPRDRKAIVEGVGALRRLLGDE